MHESWSTTGCSMLLAHSEDPFLDIDIACKAWLATWLATFKPGSFRLVNCFQSVGSNACDSRHKLSGSNAGPNASRMFYIFLMDVLHNTAHTRTIRACLWGCLLCHLILIWPLSTKIAPGSLVLGLLPSIPQRRKYKVVPLAEEVRRHRARSLASFLICKILQDGISIGWLAALDLHWPLMTISILILSDFFNSILNK